jgi:hypothetical protein
LCSSGIGDAARHSSFTDDQRSIQKSVLPPISFPELVVALGLGHIGKAYFRLRNYLFVMVKGKVTL